MAGSDSYGSARWADESDLAVEGVRAFDMPRLFGFKSMEELTKSFSTFGGRAFILSRLVSPSWLLSGIRSGYDSVTEGFFNGLVNWFNGNGGGANGDGSLIGWIGDGHITTIAPTRSGKGVGLVIPNLLHYPGSVIVVDPKGENYAITSRYRRKILGQEVVCLDPFGVCEKKTDAINPLEGLVGARTKSYTFLDENPHLLDDVSMIADAMILKTKDEKDPHWNDKARTLLKGLILGVLCGLSPDKGRHLGGARALLLQPPDMLELMFSDWMDMSDAAGGALSKATTEILSMGDHELKSVISTAARHTEFLESVSALRAIGGGSASEHASYPMKCLKTEGKVSIYMIIPPHYLSKYSRLIRLWVSAAIASMTKTVSPPSDGFPVLFMLDEIAQLGRMEPLFQAVSLMAGYGMSMWMIWQDLAQMKALYEHEWSSFLANSKIQQYFGVNDYETAKYVSDMLGEATINVASVSESSSRSKDNTKFFEANIGKSNSNTFSEVARSLLKPDEIRRLNREVMLTFVQGCPPIISKRLSYYKDSEFGGLFDENPYRITQKGVA